METLWAPWRHSYIAAQGVPGRQGVPASLDAWPGPDTGCVFCNMLGAVRWAIAEGMSAEQAERAAGIVLMGVDVFVCLNAFPYNSGHVMIVPYAHHSRLMDLAQRAATELMLTAQSMERNLRTVYRPDGVNLGANIGVAAGAGIAAHLHLHLVPRWAGDTNFMTTIAEARVLPESLDVTWARLREAVREKATPAEDALSKLT